MGVELTDLARRVSRALDGERGIRLERDDLDLLAAIGANDVLQTAAAEYQRNQCQQRAARSRSINGEGSASTRDRDATTSSPGTMLEQDASEALARAQRTLRMVSTPSTRSTLSKRRAKPSARPVDSPEPARVASS